MIRDSRPAAVVESFPAGRRAGEFQSAYDVLYGRAAYVGKWELILYDAVLWPEQTRFTGN